MNRLPCYWLQRPDEDGEDSNLSIEVGYRAMRVRITDDWVAVDADQLILPVTPLWRTQEGGVLATDPGQSGLLKQYGGERLLNDLLLGPTEPSKGTEWVIEYYPATGFTITHSTEYEPPADWLARALDDAED